METKISSNVPPNNPVPEKKSGKKKIVIITIAVLIALLSVGAIIYFIFLKLKNNEAGSGKSSNTAAKFPEIIPGSTVSEKISAKTGGQISATNAQGVKITVDIPAGSLKDDTTITLDPAEPADEDNNPDNGNGDDQNGNGDGNNPQEDEPADEPDDDGDTPPSPTCPNGICGAGETCSSCPADCGACPPPPTPPEEPTDGGFPFGGFVLGPNTLVFNPSATVTFTFPRNRRIAPGAEILVAVDRNGRSHVIPTTPSSDGSSFTAPVGGGGGFIPDDSSGGDGDGDGGDGGDGSGGGGGGDAGGVGDPANNAAIASGGKCTPEFLEAIKGEKNFAEGAPGHAAYDEALRDCLDVEKLKEQCENNPIVLRRRHFETRINIADDLDREVADELKNLLASCVAKYDITGQGSYSEAGVLTNVTMNAGLCGYLDDEWKGTYSYVITAEGGGSSCDGTESFRLPFGGGFFNVGVPCEIRVTVRDRTMSFSGGGFAFSGTFIEPSRVVLNLYGAYIVRDTAITLKEKTCNNAAYPVPPPLPSDDNIPLVPIPRR
ncbi:MAG: hypothetical protein V1804_00465 [Patescibacteria group bacterium]